MTLLNVTNRPKTGADKRQLYGWPTTLLYSFAFFVCLCPVIDNIWYCRRSVLVLIRSQIFKYLYSYTLQFWRISYSSYTVTWLYSRWLVKRHKSLRIYLLLNQEQTFVRGHLGREHVLQWLRRVVGKSKHSLFNRFTGSGCLFAVIQYCVKHLLKQIFEVVFARACAFLMY